MSSEKNSRRINLSFRLSSPDQLKAYEILNGVENKTQFITDLVLRNSDVEYVSKGTTTKEMLREVLKELLPKYMASYTAAHSVPAAAAVEEREEPQRSAPKVEEDAPLFSVPSLDVGEKEEQHPLIADAVEENDIVSDTDSDTAGDASALDVDSDFMMGLLEMMGDLDDA